MGDVTMWWILAGLLVGAELLSGTLYLLMLALGAAAGGVAAWAGIGLIAQIVVAACAGGGAALAWYARQRQRHRAARPADSDAPPPGLGHLDVGEHVQVSHWHADGTARVHHRGAEWRARLADRQGAPQTGPHRICAIERNQLVLEKI